MTVICLEKDYEGIIPFRAHKKVCLPGGAVFSLADLYYSIPFQENSTRRVRIEYKDKSVVLSAEYTPIDGAVLDFERFYRKIPDIDFAELISELSNEANDEDILTET